MDRSGGVDLQQAGHSEMNQCVKQERGGVEAVQDMRNGGVGQHRMVVRSRATLRLELWTCTCHT